MNKAKDRSILPAIFEGYEFRRAFINSEWRFSVVDAIGILTDQPTTRTASNYWAKLKQRLKEEGNETVTNCQQLKLTASDGKKRLTDTANLEELLRIIQSVPSPKAEPFKQWLAKVGVERIEEERDPSKAINRVIETYKKRGWTDKEISVRLNSILHRNDFTEEMVRDGLTEQQIGWATNALTRICLGKDVNHLLEFKGVEVQKEKKKPNLREHCGPEELFFLDASEMAAVKLSRKQNPRGYKETYPVIKHSGEIGCKMRELYEEMTGEPVVTSIDYGRPKVSIGNNDIIAALARY